MPRGTRRFGCRSFPDHRVRRSHLAHRAPPGHGASGQDPMASPSFSGHPARRRKTESRRVLLRQGSRGQTTTVDRVTSKQPNPRTPRDRIDAARGVGARASRPGAVAAGPSGNGGDRCPAREQRTSRGSWPRASRRTSLAFWFGALGLVSAIGPVARLWWTVFDWIGPDRGKMMHPHNYRVFAVVGLMTAVGLGMQAWWHWGPYIAAWPARRRWKWAMLCWAAPAAGVFLAWWFRMHPGPGP